MRKYILVNGEPVEEPDLFKWAKWFETADRVIAQNLVYNTILVSTVFLSLDDNWNTGEPILYETMVFLGDYSESDNSHFYKYETKEQALENHIKVVDEIYKNLDMQGDKHNEKIKDILNNIL